MNDNDTFPGENPPVVGFRPELYGLPADAKAFSVEKDAGTVGSIKSQCGATWDAQDVERYDGTLGVTQRFVLDHQSPVGSLRWNNNLPSLYTAPGDVNGARWGSGTLIGDNLFLTAGHCFDARDANGWTLPRRNGTTTIIPPSEIARNMHVNFNYQVDATGRLVPEYRFAVVELLEHRLGNLDYAIVRLEGNPAATFGTTDVSGTDAAVDDMLALIGHPSGRPKQIEAGPASGFTSTRIQYGDIDTLGGSSGAGVLHADSGRVVGVHTNGGCTPTGGFNVGFRISSIVAASPIIRSITSGTGQGEFYTTDGSGGISLLRRHSGWRRVWRLIVPGRFGGTYHTDLLFYDPTSGQGEFYTTDGSGRISLLRRHSGWRRVWRLIVPGNFGGSGYTDLLFYDPTTGHGEFYTTDGSGGISLLRRHTTWRRVWKWIVPGNFGGSGYTDLLFYDPTTGHGEFYTTDGSGGISLLRRHTNWRRDWTQIVPGSFGGSGYTDLLFYDPTTGHGEFYTTDGSGRISLQRRHTNWRRVWTQIIPGNFGGSAYTDLLFYDPTTGQGEFYTTDGSGGISLLRRHTTWRRVWKWIVPGNFGGSGYTDLVFYDPTTGHGEFYTTDGSGGISLLRRHTNWRRDWRLIVPGSFGGSTRTDLLFYDPVA